MEKNTKKSTVIKLEPPESRWKCAFLILLMTLLVLAGIIISIYFTITGDHEKQEENLLINPSFEWENGSIYGWDIVQDNNSKVDITEDDQDSFVLRLSCNGSCYSGIVQTLEVHYYLTQIDYINLRSYYKILTVSNATSISLAIVYLDIESLIQWSEIYELEYKQEKVGTWANDSLSILSSQFITSDYSNIVIKEIRVQIFLTTSGELLIKDIGLFIYLKPADSIY